MFLACSPGLPFLTFSEIIPWGDMASHGLLVSGLFPVGGLEVGSGKSSPRELRAWHQLPQASKEKARKTCTALMVPKCRRRGSDPMLCWLFQSLLPRREEKGCWEENEYAYHSRIRELRGEYQKGRSSEISTELGQGRDTNVLLPLPSVLRKPCLTLKGVHSSPTSHVLPQFYMGVILAYHFSI